MEINFLVLIVVVLAAFKALIGFHFPWEPIVKAKRSLSQNLESIKSSIPSKTYTEMQEQINNI